MTHLPENSQTGSALDYSTGIGEGPKHVETPPASKKHTDSYNLILLGVLDGKDHENDKGQTPMSGKPF